MITAFGSWGSFRSPNASLHHPGRTAGSPPRPVVTVVPGGGDPLSERLVQSEVGAQADTVFPRKGPPGPDLSRRCMDPNRELHAREPRSPGAATLPAAGCRLRTQAFAARPPPAGPADTWTAAVDSVPPQSSRKGGYWSVMSAE